MEQLNSTPEGKAIKPQGLWGCGLIPPMLHAYQGFALVRDKNSAEH